MATKGKTRRAEKALVEARTNDLAHAILDGAVWPLDLCEYVREREKETGSPWFVGEGEKPLSYAQIRRYAVKAEKVIAESCRTSRKRLLRIHLAKRRSLYARAVTAADYSTALRVLRDEAELLSLYGGAEPAEAATDSEAASIEGTADVVKVLAERLRQLDAADLSITDKAKLTATLADALLRAIGVDVIDKRLEALQAVLGGRKDKKR